MTYHCVNECLNGTWDWLQMFIGPQVPVDGTIHMIPNERLICRGYSISMLLGYGGITGSSSVLELTSEWVFQGVEAFERPKEAFESRG